MGHPAGGLVGHPLVKPAAQVLLHLGEILWVDGADDLRPDGGRQFGRAVIAQHGGHLVVDIIQGEARLAVAADHPGPFALVDQLGGQGAFFLLGQFFFHEGALRCAECGRFFPGWPEPCRQKRRILQRHSRHDPPPESDTYSNFHHYTASILAL